MTITLKDLFTDKTLWSRYGDMDVYNDCIDDYASAWCGTLLTKEGLEHFSKDLDFDDIEVDLFADTHSYTIEVRIDKFPDYNRKWRAIKELFSCAAGYCGCEEYDLWFMEDDDEPSSKPDENPEEPSDILEEYLERTEATMYKLNGYWIVVEEGCDEQRFDTWGDMIAHMAEQNELMRG